MEHREAFVIGAVRTPIGKDVGARKGVRPDDLAARAVAALIEGTGVFEPEVGNIYSARAAHAL